MNVAVAWQRTLIEDPIEGRPALNGHCWRCGARRQVVAGYYLYAELGELERAPWRPVCRPCDEACLADPDGDPFLAGAFVAPPGLEAES